MIATWYTVPASFPAIFALIGLLAAAPVAAAPNCYRLYDSGNRLVYEGRQPPVELADSALPRPGGGHVLWFPSAECRGDGDSAPAQASPGTSSNADVLLRRVPDSVYTTRSGGSGASATADASLSWGNSATGNAAARPAGATASPSSTSDNRGTGYKR